MKNLEKNKIIELVDVCKEYDDTPAVMRIFSDRPAAGPFLQKHL